MFHVESDGFGTLEMHLLLLKALKYKPFTEL